MIFIIQCVSSFITCEEDICLVPVSLANDHPYSISCLIFNFIFLTLLVSL